MNNPTATSAEMATLVADRTLHKYAKDYFPRRVVLEVTEHSLVDDYGLLNERLGPLREAGVRIAVDDAGAGYASMRHVLAIHPDDAQSWARLGESLVRSQDGVVGADAEAAFREAVKRDPGQLGALFFLGDAALTRGDAAEARRYWTPLMAALDPADPRRAELEQRLAGAGQ